MVADFKSDCLTDTLNKLRNILANYGYGTRAYQYPGKDIVEKAINLYSDLLKIRDVQEFFQVVTDKKDEINEISPKIEMVLDFFKGMQREQFDNARNTLQIYDSNKDFADKTDELKAVVEKMTEILTSKEPYSEIHNLPMLRKDLIDLLIKMYDAKSEPIINMINDTITYIENEVKNAEVREDFGTSYIKTCKDVINTLEHSNELKDIYAQQTRIDQLKDRFINALEYEKSKAKIIEETGKEPEKEKVVIVPRKVIRTDVLMNRSYEINSREDIDRYVEELKGKLLKEFEENNNLTIR